jgi:dCTP deaminase
LHNTILVPKSGQTISITGESPQYTEVSTEEGYTLKPGDFVLGSTSELIQTPKNVVAILDGRSTIARLGLTIHVTASFLDGSIGNLLRPVLEIKNIGNFSITIRDGDPIGMILFSELSEEVETDISSQYPEQFGKDAKVLAPNTSFDKEK